MRCPKKEFQQTDQIRPTCFRIHLISSNPARFCCFSRRYLMRLAEIALWLLHPHQFRKKIRRRAVDVLLLPPGGFRDRPPPPNLRSQVLRSSHQGGGTDLLATWGHRYGQPGDGPSAIAPGGLLPRMSTFHPPMGSMHWHVR